MRAVNVSVLFPSNAEVSQSFSRVFYDKRISQEVPADTLGDEWKGYVFRITGGNDKQGFPMKQGVLLPYRVRLLLSDGHSCYRIRRTGERKRKSVRGCIVGPDIAVLSLVIVKQGENEIPGLTDNVLPKRLGPKRATKIRKFFNLSKEDDVRKYVVRREVKSAKKENAKPYTKAYVSSSRCVLSRFVDRPAYPHIQSENPAPCHPPAPPAPPSPPLPQAPPDRAPEGAEDRVRGPPRQAHRREEGEGRRRQGITQEVCSYLLRLSLILLENRATHIYDFFRTA